ncbi:MAG: hypothetical protein ACFB14_14150 [Leptolyngbyaceae cyanobacterium]
MSLSYSLTGQLSQLVTFLAGVGSIGDWQDRFVAKAIGYTLNKCCTMSPGAVD